MSSLGLVSKNIILNVVRVAPRSFYCVNNRMHSLNLELSRGLSTFGKMSQSLLKFRPSCLHYNLSLPQVSLTTCPKPHSDNKYTVTFVKASGDRVTAKGKEGDSLLDVVVNNDLDFDGFGACEGTLTCSTCHCIFKQEDYDKLPEQPSDEELDMLDLAYELTDTSRLGCQIQLTKELDGLEVKVPATINDARS